MKRVLTGIKPTGLPHIGNYFGAIKPALECSSQYDSFYFIADYHALTTMRDKETLQDYSFQIAAAWLALGLDPQKTIFYRQSDISEIYEFAWILSCLTSKGLLNRAHAYKAAVDNNLKSHQDMDHNINQGLFNYPVLMAADILLFKTDLVPVGADQKQHIEIARDIAETFNRHYGNILTLPEPLIHETTQIIPGIDGLKMSKNYNNTIPIFLPEKKLRKRIMQIVTDSMSVEQAKDPSRCNIFQLFKLFSTTDQQTTLANQYRAGGLGYGEVKQQLFEHILNYFSDARSRYNDIMNHKKDCQNDLKKGQQKARKIAQDTLTTVKKAIGITDL